MSPRTKYRLLEMIPGVINWITLILAVVLSVVKPLWMVYFIVAFDFYWMVKVLYFTTYLIIAYGKFRRAATVNWLSKAQALPRFADIVHLVIIPNANEGIEVLRTTFGCLAQSHYPTQRMIVVLATEERTKQIGEENGRLIQAEYGHQFLRLLVTQHPKNIQGEIAGKGANLTWAAQQVKPLIEELKLKNEDVVVSTLDADTCVHPAYFAYLTHTYLTAPKPLRTSYQPIPLFNNNIWDAPMVMRVAARGTTFWLMSELMRPERLWTFSSHSMSYQALLDVGYWQTDVVSDDSRIFLQCFLEYDGDYTVQPMYIPLNMDTVVGKDWWSSLKNLYKQQRRWAYGAENIPFMVWQFSKAKKIPLAARLRLTFNQLEGMWSWATNPLLILILGYIPFYFLSDASQLFILPQNTPGILRNMLTISNLGLLTSLVLGMILLPSRPAHVPKWKILTMVIQWIFLPVSMIVFGSIPAFESHTRLMLGKYLGFYVTEKARKESGE